MSADRSTRYRTGRPAETPTFSLVATSRGDPGALRAMLAGLLPLCAAHGVQMVVVRAGPADEVLALAEQHPAARFLLPPGDAAPGALRAAGMAAAEGDVVLFGADDDPVLRERLLHLLASHGVLAAGAEDTPERSRPDADPQQRRADGGTSATRQDLPSLDALEASECQHRAPQHPAAWTGSPRETGWSSSVPAPAG
jgi:hypothetical protein